jgi:hypothetical protein
MKASNVLIGVLSNGGDWSIAPPGNCTPRRSKISFGNQGSKPHAAYVAIKPFYSVNIKMMIRLGLNAVSPNGDLLLIFTIFLSPYKRDITRNSAGTDGIYPGSKLVSLGGSRIR